MPPPLARAERVSQGPMPSPLARAEPGTAKHESRKYLLMFFLPARARAALLLLAGHLRCCVQEAANMKLFHGKPNCDRELAPMFACLEKALGAPPSVRGRGEAGRCLQ